MSQETSTSLGPIFLPPSGCRSVVVVVVVVVPFHRCLDLLYGAEGFPEFHILETSVNVGFGHHLRWYNFRFFLQLLRGVNHDRLSDGARAYLGAGGIVLD